MSLAECSRVIDVHLVSAKKKMLMCVVSLCSTSLRLNAVDEAFVHTML